MWRQLAPIVLLIGSNVFMTVAWYGHLKDTNRPLMSVIMVSWGIAFFEHCLQVPAIRIGRTVHSAAPLKILHGIITFFVFVIFSVTWLGAELKWNLRWDLR